MSFAFARARGLSVGTSKVEEEGVSVAAEALKKAEDSSGRLVLPTDVVVADELAEDAAAWVVGADAIPDGWMGVDIGTATAKSYAEAVMSAGEVFWNGPMGVFEMAPFAEGTQAVAEAMAACPGLTVVGGGDTVAAINKFSLADKMDHVSLGGGASLEFLEGADLPGVISLPEKEQA